MATAAVLFTKPDKGAINKAIIRICNTSEFPTCPKTKFPTRCINPVRSIAAESTNIHNTVIVAIFENPDTPSEGVTRPNKIRETIIRSAVISTGKRSVVNKYNAQRKIIPTCKIGDAQYRATNVTPTPKANKI